MLKPSEEFFKFPVRMFDPLAEKEDDYINDLLSSSGPPKRERKRYIVGWKAVWADRIEEYNEMFTIGKTLDEVEKDGMDLTVLTISGDSFMCDWPIHVFEAEYNKHCRKLKRYYAKQRKENPDDTEIQILELKP